jgi:hypothetical protein
MFVRLVVVVVVVVVVAAVVAEIVEIAVATVAIEFVIEDRLFLPSIHLFYAFPIHTIKSKTHKLNVRE